MKGRLTLDTSVPGWHGIGCRGRESAEPGALAESRGSPLRHHRPRDVQPGAGAGPPLSARHLRLRRRARDVPWDTPPTTFKARGQITATRSCVPACHGTGVRRERHDRGRLDRHRRAVSLPLSGDDRPASTCRRLPPNRSGAARREPADVRLRRRRAAFSNAVHRRATPCSPSPSFSAPRSRRAPSARRHIAATRSLRRRRRRRRPQHSAIWGRRSMSPGCAIRAMPASWPVTFASTCAGTDSATMALTGGGRSRARRRSTACSRTPTCPSTSRTAPCALRTTAAFDKVDPAVPFDDERFTAALTGIGPHDGHRPRSLHANDNAGRLRGAGFARADFIDRSEAARGAWVAGRDAAQRRLEVARAELAGGEIEGAGPRSIGLGEAGTVDFALRPDARRPCGHPR